MNKQDAIRRALLPPDWLHYTHVVIDTTDDDFKDWATNCDLLVIPAVPESVATDGLTDALSIRFRGTRRLVSFLLACHSIQL